MIQKKNKRTCKFHLWLSILCIIFCLVFIQSPSSSETIKPIFLTDLSITNQDDRSEVLLRLTDLAEVIVYPIDKKTVIIDLLSDVYADEMEVRELGDGLIASAHFESGIKEKVNGKTPRKLIDMILLKLREPYAAIDSQIMKDSASIILKRDGLEKYREAEHLLGKERKKVGGLFGLLFKGQEDVERKSVADEQMKEKKPKGKKEKLAEELTKKDLRKIRQLFNQARRAEKKDDYEAAIELYSRVLFKDPENREAKKSLKKIIQTKDKLNPLTQVQGDGIDDYDKDNLSLADCIEIAKRNHLPIKVGEYQIEVAKKRIFIEKRNLFPTLTLETTNTGGVNVQEEEFSGRRYSAQTQYQVFDGGRLRNTIKQNEINLEVAEQDLRRIKGDIKNTVTGNYYSLIRTKENYLLQKRVMQVANQVLEKIESLENVQMVTEPDYLNFLAEYNSTAFAFTTAKEDVEIAELILKQTMAVRPVLKIDVIPDYTFKRIDIDYEECLRLALKNSPEIILARKLLSYYALEMKIVNARSWPTFTLNGNVGRGAEGTVDNRLKLADEWFVGSIMRVPFWGNTIEYQASKDVSGPQTSTFSAGAESVSNAVRLRVLDALGGDLAVKEAKVEYERQKRELGSAMNTAIVGIQELFLAYQKSFTVMDSSILRIRGQEIGLRLTNLKIGLGEAQPTALLGAESSLAQEKFSYIQSITDYITTIAGLNKAVGIDNYFNFDEENSNEVKNEN